MDDSLQSLVDNRGELRDLVRGTPDLVESAAGPKYISPREKMSTKLPLRIDKIKEAASPITPHPPKKNLCNIVLL